MEAKGRHGVRESAEDWRETAPGVEMGLEDWETHRMAEQSGVAADQLLDDTLDCACKYSMPLF